MVADHIIDPGGESDRDAIPLYTRKRNRIRNEKREQMLPERMHTAIEIMEGIGESVRCRSAASTYNCVGMVFANRRTWVETDQLSLIFHDDGYEQILDMTELRPGDVVVYSRDDEISHVGIVQEVGRNIVEGSWEITVLSQWGRDGEYLHLADEVHELLGKVAGYITERRPCDA